MPRDILCAGGCGAKTGTLPHKDDAAPEAIGRGLCPACALVHKNARVRHLAGLEAEAEASEGEPHAS